MNLITSNEVLPILPYLLHQPPLSIILIFPSEHTTFSGLYHHVPRNTAFKPPYTLHYTLTVSGRTQPERVNAAQCRFCLTFEREAVKHECVLKTNHTLKDTILFKQSPHQHFHTVSQYHTSWALVDLLNLSVKKKETLLWFDAAFVEKIFLFLKRVDWNQVKICCNINGKVIKPLFGADDSNVDLFRSIHQLLHSINVESHQLHIFNVMNFSRSLGSSSKTSLLGQRKSQLGPQKRFPKIHTFRGSPTQLFFNSPRPLQSSICSISRIS